MNSKVLYNTQAKTSNHTDVISLSSSVKVLMELVKIRITFLVTLTTALGYIMGAEFIDMGLVYTVLGIFLLACAASVMNHWQERNYDGMMSRTSQRPIPSGRVESSNVLLIFIVLLLSGSAILIFKSTIESFLIGIITLIWYNAVYTPLKRKTAFAIIPGSLVGALPPLAGWAAVSSDLLDPRIILIAVYFFVWQIPHFWLLLIMYNKEYESAGYPTLNQIFSNEQLKRLTFMWLISTVITALIIPLTGAINYVLTNILLIAASIWMIYTSIRFLINKQDEGSREPINTFVKINFYTLLLICFISADKLIKIFNI